MASRFIAKNMRNKFSYTSENLNHFRDIVKSEYKDKIKVVDITKLPDEVQDKFRDKTLIDRSILCISEFYPYGTHKSSNITYGGKAIEFRIDDSDNKILMRLHNIIDCEDLNECSICCDIKEEGIRCLMCFKRICLDCFERIQRREYVFLIYVREGDITVRCPFCKFNFLRDIGETVEDVVVTS